MYWFTSRDGTRFLVQTPSECAQSLAAVFSEPGQPMTSRRFMQHLKQECPPTARARRGLPARTAKR
jgi:hypothetical protein